MRRWLPILFAVLFALSLIMWTPMAAMAQYNLEDGYRLAWTLDPRDDPENFTRGPAYGARSVKAGMDFDGDGYREILFSTDETLAPGGPEPGNLDVYLYENNGNDSFEHVWHYSCPEESNSLPALGYGDMDQDGNWEIYFGVPTLESTNKLFVFEQDETGAFPETPTLTYGYERDVAYDLRPSGFQVEDVDDDGDVELVTVTRVPRELIVISLDSEQLDEFAAFKIEFEAGSRLNPDDPDETLEGGSVYDVQIVDFDGDGMKEIWVNTWDLWSMAVYEVQGADTYALEVNIDEAKSEENDPGSLNANDMAFVDADNDGLLEAWFPMSDGKLYFIDDIDSVGALTAEHVKTVGTFAPSGRARGSDVGDLDQDGRWDIIGAHGRDEMISRMEYNGIGSPEDSTSYTWSTVLESVGEPQERYYPLDLPEVDLDGDGFKEIVQTNLYASSEGQPLLMVIEHDPATAPSTAPNWETVTAVSHSDVDELFASDFSGNSRTVIGGFDMDEDGAKEAIITDYGGARVVVFEYNETADVFEMVWASPVDTLANRRIPQGNPRTVTVADLDGDSKSEIIFPLASEPSGWYVFEWDGEVGSDNYGTVYSSIIQSEIDICCPDDYTAFRADHERVNVMDIDQDGVQEMLIAIRRGGTRGTLVTTVEGDIEFEAGGGGFETWVTEFHADQNNFGGGSPYQALPADLDGDGTWEIVNHTWNYFNFYNLDVTGADSYATPDTNSDKRHYQATYPNDHVSLFGGAAGDVDGNGDDEAFFPNYYTGDIWVIDYEAGDNVLEIDGDHVVNVLPNMGNAYGGFYASLFDSDQDGMTNVFTGSSYPKTITSAELIGDDPRNPSDYVTEVIYTGEEDVLRDIVITDSAGVITTEYANTSPFASKVQAEFRGEGIDFDNDGQYELLASFQSNVDSITTTTITWNPVDATWDTTETKVVNDKSWAMMLFEFTGGATAVEEMPVDLVTPEDYRLEQNYPNPFNPTTTISYTLPIQKQVTLRVYNVMGQVVKTLVNDQVRAAGQHQVVWDGSNDKGLQVASGTYLYSLEFGNFRKTRQMTFVK